MKIRNGFVSNSSSTSFVVIDASNGYNSYTPTGKELTEGFEGETEFGLGPDTISDIGSKINFAALQAKYTNDPKHNNMLKEAVKKGTGLDIDCWYIVLTYNHPEGYRWGYIDHQSAAIEGENLEIFESEEKLYDFIFGRDSEIVLDNDNHDDYYEW